MGSRLRGYARFTLLMLAAGFAVNLAVAWGGQWAAARPWSRDRFFDPPGAYFENPPIRWVRPAPGDWPAADREMGIRQWVQDERFVSSGLGSIVPPGVQISSGGLSTVEQAYFAAGWPMRSVHWWANIDNRGVAAGGTPVIEYIGNVEWPAWLAWHARGGSFAVRPIWGGLVTNTVCYAVMAGVIGVLIRRVVRLRRVRRRLCPACAYPTGASSVCSECGEPQVVRGVQ